MSPRANQSSEVRELRERVSRLQEEILRLSQSVASAGSEPSPPQTDPNLLALERSNRDLQEFAFAISHDLQEPLRSILSLSELLRRRCGDRIDAGDLELLDQITRSAAGMRRLIEDLLRYSQAAHGATQFVTVDMNGVLQWVLSNLSSSIESAGAKITSSPLPTVHGDFTSLAQVLQNLISNALRYSKGTPKIEITAVSKDDHWIFSVRDEGIGIDPRYHAQIFGLFKRLHGPEHAGAGVGLAIAKRVVERHGGEIWVDSELGRGATFHFTIPA